MKRCMLLCFVCYCSLLMSQPAATKSAAPKAAAPKTDVKKQKIDKKVREIIPSDFFTQMSSSDQNWMERKINMAVRKAVQDRKVSLEKISDYLYLQIVPSFVYRGEEGEEKLGEDLLGILGTIKAGENAMIMSFSWKQLTEMNLPFERKLVENLLIEPRFFGKDIELTFYVELNTLTNLVYNGLKRLSNVSLRYNSQRRFYRVEGKKTGFFYMVHVPNIAYEIIYSGLTYEMIIKRYLEEIRMLQSVMAKYTDKIKKANGISWDGRYLKSEKGVVDLWFLYTKSREEKKEPSSYVENLLNGKPVQVTGKEK